MATARKKAAKKKATKKKAAKGGGASATSQKGAKQSGKKKGQGFGVLDLLRNPILASVGAFSLAEEGLERLVSELIDRGEASEREGKKIVEDYRKRTSKTRKEFQRDVDSRIADALKSFRLPVKKDVDDLRRKITALEQRIDTLLAQRKPEAG